MYSLFEEQLRQRALRRAELLDEPADSFGEALSYFPATAYDDPGPRDYLSLLERAAATTPIPVIASLNGVTPAAAYLLAGADVVMTASALLRHRPEHAAVLLDGLTTWMARKGFQTTSSAACSLYRQTPIVKATSEPAMSVPCARRTPVHTRRTEPRWQPAVAGMFKR